MITNLNSLILFVPFRVFFKLTNRQMKLKVLKDEAITKIEKLSTPKEKKFKCGQCEKGLAFTVNININNNNDRMEQ